MPTLMPTDTRNALGPNADRCDSRSLLFDRFVDPAAKEAARKQVFTRAMGKPPIRAKQNGWPPFLRNGLGLQPTDLLFGKLQARLMVNMAGGVMENAGLCLDRFGVPYIPGSAVKGCARRMAIEELFELGAGFHSASGPESMTAKSQRLDRCAELLVQIARVFGWCELDWSGKPDQSDFRYACGADDWEEIRERAAKLLFAAFPNWEPDTKKLLWQSLPNYAGSVSFLPAYPIQAPNPDLELDVVTCHHRDYYAGKLPVATDTEEPNPVVFPAVAPGHVFAFAVVPLRNCDAVLLNQARNWLRQGLETFGLGAKTNAGYGWFDCSDGLQTAVSHALEEQARREREAYEREQAEQRRKAEEAERLRQKRELETALANLSGEERADKEIELLTDQQFDGKVRAFCKDPKHGGPTEEQKKAIVRALRGPRLTYWQDFKTKATKGEPAKVADAIRQLCKQMNLGKMP